MSVHDSVISGSMYDAEKAATMQDDDARFVVLESYSAVAISMKKWDSNDFTDVHA